MVQGYQCIETQDYMLKPLILQMT